MKILILFLFCFLLFGCQSENFICCPNKNKKVENNIVKTETNKGSEHINSKTISNYENENEDPKDVTPSTFLIDIPPNILLSFDYLSQPFNQDIFLTQDQIVDNFNKIKEKDIIKNEVKDNSKNYVKTIGIIIGIAIVGIVLFIIIYILLYYI